MQRSWEPELHSSQILTWVVGRTFESQIGHLPSHLSQSLPTEMPASLLQKTRSASCLAAIQLGYRNFKAWGWLGRMFFRSLRLYRARGLEPVVGCAVRTGAIFYAGSRFLCYALQL